jgi:hypothetical protein
MTHASWPNLFWWGWQREPDDSKPAGGGHDSRQHPQSSAQVLTTRAQCPERLNEISFDLDLAHNKSTSDAKFTGRPQESS